MIFKPRLLQNRRRALGEGLVLRLELALVGLLEVPEDRAAGLLRDHAHLGLEPAPT